MVRVFGHFVPRLTAVELSIDAFIYFAAFMVGVAGQRAMFGGHIENVEVLIGVALAIMMLGLNTAFGLYRRDEVAFGHTLLRTLAATLLGAGFLYVLLLALLPRAPFAVSALRLSVPYALLGLVVFRRTIIELQRKGIGLRRVLVVGSGVEAQSVLEVLQRQAHPRFAIAGVFEAGEGSMQLGSVRTFSKTQRLWDVVREQRVDEVVVAVRERRGGVLPLRDLLECRVRGVAVVDETAFFERTRGEFPLEALKASWLIYGQGFEQGWMRATAKRVFDLIAATTLLILALPVMLLTALLIKLESAGPVIYRQQRVGLFGRPFNCLKFRSMAADAERDGVAKWATTRDARITRIGRIIRATRIDELPQLFNVLAGQMSLVGPRPERPVFVDQLKRDIRYYDIRHSVKPGITGWAQVRFTYASSLEETRRKLQFDLYYVKNNSLFMDALILLETVRVVLLREGAR
jgi:sugar transferase (PEP-CTERM system associated)